VPVKGTVYQGLFEANSEKNVGRYTDKKENKTFLIYKEIQMGSGAVCEEGLPIFFIISVPNPLFILLQTFTVLFQELS
jgi:hypothetical protein